MKLHAISDLHVSYEANRRGLEAVTPRPKDWLILAGDLGETAAHVSFVLQTMARKFARLIWVPGNHELWTLPNEVPQLRGEAKYERLVALCRQFDVVTPEDPFPLWDGEGPAHAEGRSRASNGGGLVIAPLFLLYDYSFCPDGMSPEMARAWALEEGIVCADEGLLDPEPHATRDAWCRARCALAEARLAAIPADTETVIVNHFPLRMEHARLPAVPRFTPWCGTRRTNDWHTRFRARVVVGGHLHIRTTRWVDGVRFEEVSLGYPRQWSTERGVDAYLREILPGPAPPAGVIPSSLS